MNGHQPASRAQGGPRRQNGGSGHIFRAANEQRMSAVPLMGEFRTGQRQAGRSRRVGIEIERLGPIHILLAQADRQHDDLAGRLAPLRKQQGQFRKLQRQRRRRPDRRTPGVSELGEHSRRQIDRHDPAAARIDPSDRPEQGLGQLAPHARPEQRIDDHRTLRQRRLGHRTHGQTARKTLQIESALLGEFIPAEREIYRAGKACPVQHPGYGQSVPSVIALAYEKSQRALRPDMPGHPLRDTLRSTLHQSDAVDRLAGDRIAIGLTNPTTR